MNSAQDGARPSPGQPRLRSAASDDLDGISVIERAAAARFPPEALPTHMRDRVLPRDVLEQALGGGLLWVVDFGGTVPIGFLAAKTLDGNLHVVEMSVLPEYGRQGAGTALLGAVLEEARRRNIPRVTLTTFSHVPWNAPFYRKRGFREMGESECGLELLEQLHEEERVGLTNRVAMAAVLTTEN